MTNILRKPARWPDVAINPAWRAGLVAALPCVGGGGNAFDKALPNAWTATGTGGAGYVNSKGERRLALTDTSSQWQQASAALVPTGPITILVKFRKTDVTLRASTLFGVTTGGSTDRCSSHCPYSDGVVYWDYGGASAGTTRVSAAGLTFGDDVFVFTVGGRGMEIWQNGVLQASNGATPTRVASSSTFMLGHGVYSGVGSDLVEYSCFLMYSRQLSSAAIKQLSIDPFLPFRIDGSVSQSFGKAGAVSSKIPQGLFRSMAV